MTADDDRLLDALAGLPELTPDIDRETRVRRRCHAAMTKRTVCQALERRRLSRAGLLIAAAALCAYWTAALREAVRLAVAL